MTILVTAVREEFVLSVADRRSSVQFGTRFVARDDRFNKHVYFCLEDDKKVRLRGAASFTGVAEWCTAAGKTVTTDEVIAGALSRAAPQKLGTAYALHEVAAALAEARQYLERRVRGPFPGFTVTIGGFLSAIREPIMAVITDGPDVPNWDEDLTQVEIPAPAPFRIHTAVRLRPTRYVAGYLPALSPQFSVVLDRILNAPAIRAYDLARYVVREIRRAAKRTGSVGSRVSAILLPANGWVDTGLWQDRDEPLRYMMPATVDINGAILQSSEVDLELTTVVGELQRDGLLFEGMVDGRVRKRLFRRAKRFRSAHNKAPTTFGLMMFGLFGIDPVEAGRRMAAGEDINRWTDEE